MTIMDKVEAAARTSVQAILDKEPISYLEASSLYSIIASGRHNLCVLEVLYNHAQDPELKNLIKDAIDNIVVPAIDHCEVLLEQSGAQTPHFRFSEHQLHQDLDIPSDARLTDYEISANIAIMARASQVSLLAALHESYQLEVGGMYRKFLDAGLDWNYRLSQLMIHRGWLPHLAKITH